ncbi:response regulator receiver protein [Paraglaciecola chathamensis S18K6]|uniref:Response regulator receiver protein n=2 Tax=Paraglaciecola chathamensis TaxID=368405 RepID=A0AAV3UYH6_9ALTE|nr:response regulator receiver protein [Paraglaciecola chathamensis S18K6]
MLAWYINQLKASMFNHHINHTRLPIIYLVDHQRKGRSALTELLAPLGAQIENFPSAKRFLQHDINAQAACLLLEAHLEDKKASGIALLEQMADREIYIPTIILASSSDIPTAVRAMRANAIDFIEKPYVEHMLVRQVKSLLSQTRSTQLHTPTF